MSLTKAEREQGYKAAPQPSPHITAILRRVALGFVLATRVEENGAAVVRYCYDDGTVIRTAKGRPVDANTVSRMIAEGWLIPIKGETLPLGEEGPPQRYRARTVADGLLPKFIAPPRR